MTRISISKLHSIQAPFPPGDIHNCFINRICLPEFYVVIKLYNSILTEFELVTGSSVNEFWTTLFTKHFLTGSFTTDDTRDDMLFYVRKSPNDKGKFYMKVQCCIVDGIITCTFMCVNR